VVRAEFALPRLDGLLQSGAFRTKLRKIRHSGHQNRNACPSGIPWAMARWRYSRGHAPKAPLINYNWASAYS
jgi:hypothetical protein